MKYDYGLYIAGEKGLRRVVAAASPSHSVLSVFAIKSELTDKLDSVLHVSVGETFESDTRRYESEVKAFLSETAGRLYDRVNHAVVVVEGGEPFGMKLLFSGLAALLGGAIKSLNIVSQPSAQGLIDMALPDERNKLLQIQKEGRLRFFKSIDELLAHSPSIF